MEIFGLLKEMYIEASVAFLAHLSREAHKVSL